MIVLLCPPIYTYPSIHFRKIDKTTKNSVGFNRFPPASIIQGGGGGDAMLFHDGGSYHLETSPLICRARIGNEDNHCVESVQILSFFWSLFSRIRTEYEKCSVSLSVFSPNAGKYGPEKTPYLDSFHTVNISVSNFILKCLVTINFH